MGGNQAKEEKRDTCVGWNLNRHAYARATLRIMAGRLKRYSYSPEANQAITNATEVITIAMKADVDRQAAAKPATRGVLVRDFTGHFPFRKKEARLGGTVVPGPKVVRKRPKDPRVGPRKRKYVYRWRPSHVVQRRNALAKRAAAQAGEGSHTTEQNRRP